MLLENDAGFHLTFQEPELLKATNGKNPSNFIGSGGFGEVYKGRIRGTAVAVKFLSKVNIEAG